MTDVLDAVVSGGARVRTFVEAAAAGDLGGWPIGEATDEERIRALIMAADHQRFEVMDRLLEAGTPIDAVDSVWHRHPLRLAAEHGRPDSVRYLLARGADPTLTDRDGRSALELCQGKNRYMPGPRHDEVAELLRTAISARR